MWGKEGPKTADDACAVCGKRIPPGESVFLLGATLALIDDNGNRLTGVAHPTCWFGWKGRRGAISGAASPESP